MFKRALILLLLYWVSFECSATFRCTTDTATATVALPASIQWQSEVPTAWYTLSTSTLATCEGSGKIEWAYTMNATQAGSYNLGGVDYAMFPTPAPGVYFILEYMDWMNAKAWTPAKAATFLGWYTTTTSTLRYTLKSDVRIRFVRGDGARPAGKIDMSGFPIAVVTARGDVSPGANTQLNATGTSLASKSKSCSLTVPPSVRLPRVNTADLAEVGAIAGKTQFDISVNCTDSFSNYAVSYYLTDVAAPANVSTDLTLLEGSVPGIALQIQDGTTVVKFGAQPTAGNRMLFGTIPAAGGSLVKSLSVSYKRIGKTLVSGSLSAAAAITLSYQ